MPFFSCGIRFYVSNWFRIVVRSFTLLDFLIFFLGWQRKIDRKPQPPSIYKCLGDFYARSDIKCLREMKRRYIMFVQMLCPHAMAILSAISSGIPRKQKYIYTRGTSSKLLFANKTGRRFMCVINFANYAPLWNQRQSNCFGNRERQKPETENVDIKNCKCVHKQPKWSSVKCIQNMKFFINSS